MGSLSVRLRNILPPTSKLVAVGINVESTDVS